MSACTVRSRRKQQSRRRAHGARSNIDSTGSEPASTNSVLTKPWDSCRQQPGTAALRGRIRDGFPQFCIEMVWRSER